MSVYVNPVESGILTGLSQSGEIIELTPPTVSGNYPAQAIIVNTPFNFNGAANFSSDTPLTYSAIGLPATLSINPSTGIITGTPVIVANYIINIIATDVDNLTASAQLPLSVQVQPVDKTIFIDSLIDVNGNVQSNLTGLSWAFYDSDVINNLGNAVDSGTVETTDANGAITIVVANSALNSGQFGTLLITDEAGRRANYRVAIS